MKPQTDTLQKRWLLPLLGLALMQSPAHAIDGRIGNVDYQLTGYIREHISMNLQDHPEVSFANGQTIGGKGELSMARTTLKLEGGLDFGFAQLFAVGRVDREYHTDYLEDLEDSAAASSVLVGPPGLGDRFLDMYDDEELREYVVMFDVGDRVRATLGRQQVVWGETDFFRAMDIIHGYDLRWRSFLELENEELRKPLILANIEFDVPELDGVLQLIYRPGWDKDEDIGNTLDFSGGRWSPQPLHGLDSLFSAPYNYKHASGDYEDENYGLRWSGTFRRIGYSFNYYRGFNGDPVVNSFAGILSGNNVGGGMPANGFAEIIYPLIDTFGFTMNAYLAPIDSVLRGEFAYTPNKPYNIGTSGAFGVNIPGIGGIVEKQSMVSMLGIDKNLNLSNLLGTIRPSVFTAQLFDTWIMDYDRADDIVETFGYGAHRREHTTIGTAALTLNYAGDTVNPGLAVVYDFSAGDAVMLPNVELVYGSHWRIRAEMNIFLTNHSKDAGDAFAESLGVIENKTRLLGTFANNSQAVVRVTYQF